MFENVCTVPLDHDVSSVAVHPTEPLILVGQSSGHVQCFRLPEVSAPAGKGMIETAWRTRRHKGSCRNVSFSCDGLAAYSAGTDSLLKHFDSSTGIVVSKIRIPTRKSSSTLVEDPATALCVITPHALLLGCDSGALHVMDLRQANSSAGNQGDIGGYPAPKPAQTLFPHDDYISSITPLPSNPTRQVAKGLHNTGAPTQIISTGATTLALTDLRRGVCETSDDQGDNELLSSAYVDNPKGNAKRGLLLVGTAAGAVTVWDRGKWKDYRRKMPVSREESVDCISVVPEEVVERAGEAGTKAVFGLGDGWLRVADVAKLEVEFHQSLKHDETDGASSLSFDCFGRLISGGGQVVKVWGVKDKAESESEESETADEDEESDGEDDDEDGEDDEFDAESGRRAKRPREEDDSNDEDKPRSNGKKKKNKAFGPYGAHGIMAFPDL